LAYLRLDPPQAKFDRSPGMLLVRAHMKNTFQVKALVQC